MSTNITLRRSAVQGKVPLTTDLALGELALNTFDGKIFMKKNENGTESIVDVGRPTDLSTTYSGTVVTINSSTGANTTITGANSTAAGVVTTGTQTFAGDKTFTDDVGIFRTPPADFWGGNNNSSLHTGYGFLGSHGSFSLDLFANGYRNSSGTWTTLNTEGSTSAAGIRLSTADGSITFAADEAKATGSSVTLTPRMTVTAAGNVGIGTAAPATKLDVAGDVTIADKIVHSGDTNTAIRFPVADTVTIETAGSERMRITSAGNVGIGTTTPTSIVGGTDTSPVLSIGGTDTTLVLGDKAGSVSFMTNDASYTGIYADGVTSEIASVSENAFGSAFGLAMFTGGNVGGRAERLRINQSGNVGIGTTTPATKLDVNGEIIGRSTATVQGTFNVEDAINYNGASNFYIRSRLNGGTVQIGTETPAGTLYYPINIVGATDYTAFNTSTSEAMRIIANGNVGIGTSSPESALTVNPGNSATTPIGGRDISYGVNVTTSSGRTGVLVRNANAFTSINSNAGFQWLYPFDTGGTDGYKVFRSSTGATLVDKFWVDQAGGGYFAGNVGIGTTTPSYTLDVVSDSSARGIQIRGRSADDIGIFRFVTNTNSAELFKIQVSNVSTNINSILATPMVFFTNNTEKMRIIANGNVGIGTNIPDVGLHYTGDTPKLRIESTNSLDDTLGTEEIGRIEWEATRGSNRNVAASIRVQQAGTWSTVTPWLSPTSMAFYTQDNTGVEVTSPRLFIGSTGNVGIGETSPAALLHLTDDTAFKIQLQRTGGSPSICELANSGNLLNLTNNVNGVTFSTGATPTEKMRIGGNGNVGIGTTTPATLLDVAGDITIADKIIHSGDTNTAIRFPAADTVTVETNGSERMRITSAGNVGIGTSSPASILHVSSVDPELLLTDTSTGVDHSLDGNSGVGNLYLHADKNNEGSDPKFVLRVGASLDVLVADGAGNVGIGTAAPATKLDVNGEVTAVDFNTTSDINVKENIFKIDDALNKVQQLNGVTFNFIDDDTKTRHAGVIAQDVEKVLPEAVKELDGIKHVAYGNLIGLLIEAIKEQQKQIDELQSLLNK